MKDTKIEWCDHEWSPWMGCTKVSPGCANYYAETLSKRNPAVLGQWGKGKPRVLAKNWGDPVKWNREHELTVDASHDGMYDGPSVVRRIHRPTVFPSLCDWLDDEVPVEWLARFLQLIYDTPNLNWLLPTKRPENWEQRLRDVCVYFQGLPGDWREAPAWQLANRWCPHNGVHRFDPPANVWVGTSVEDQTRADERIPALLRIPAVGRFLSMEPLLGPVDLEPFMIHGRDITDEGYSRLDGIHWVIIGGESGHGARPCNVEWIRSFVRQCKDASVPVFVKQLGAKPATNKADSRAIATEMSAAGCFNVIKLTHPKGGDPAEWPADLRVREFPEALR